MQGRIEDWKTQLKKKWNFEILWVDLEFSDVQFNLGEKR